MAKTPYEVRLACLEMARDSLQQEHSEKKDAKVQMWENQVSRLKDDDALPEYPTLDAPPSVTAIVEKANELYAFVSDDQKTPDSKDASAKFNSFSAIPSKEVENGHPQYVDVAIKMRCSPFVAERLRTQFSPMSQ